MKKKGFTLVELLAVLVIIGILMGLATSAVSRYMNRGKKEYYNSLEISFKNSVHEYMIDYRSLLPREIGNTTVVTLEELVENNYIDEIMDEDKKACTGTATIEKLAKDKYDYHICLKCNTRYTSDEENCEFVGTNNEAKSYRIEVGNFDTAVNQCQSLGLPKAVVYEKINNEESIIDSNLVSNPKSVDTTILGETTVKWTYRYKSISKIVIVEDKISPTTPTLKLAYLSGKEYIAKNSDGTINYTNQDLNMTVSSKDYACPTIYPKLEGSGIAYIAYKEKDQTKWNEYETKETTRVPLSKTLFGEAELKVVDNYNNSSEIVTFEAYLDKVKPSKTEVTYNGGSSSSKFKNNYDILLEATDDVAIAYYEIDYDADGIYDEITNGNYIPKNGMSYDEVRFRAVDIAGNRGDWSDKQQIHMDTTAPSITTVNLNGYTSGGWTNQSVKQTYSATDSLSGVVSYEYSYDKVKIVGTTTKEWTLSTDGEYTLYARAVDEAGNRGSWSNVYYIKRDTVKPSCTLVVSNAPTSANGYYTSEVKVAFSKTSDDRSQINTTSIDTPVVNTSSTSDGHTVTGTVIDKANNSNTCIINIKMDVTTPTVTAKKNPIGLGTEDYTFTSNVTTEFGGSGGTITCDPASSKKTGSYTVTCTATGNNGLTASVSFTAGHSYAATYVKQTCGGDCNTYYSNCTYVTQGDTANNHWSCNCGSSTDRLSSPSSSCCKRNSTYDCSYYKCNSSSHRLSGSTCYY